MRLCFHRLEKAIGLFVTGWAVRTGGNKAKGLTTLLLWTAALVLLDTATFGGDPGPDGLFGLGLETLYLVAPAIAGVAIALFSFLDRTSALTVVLLCTVGMIVLDLLPVEGDGRAVPQLIVDSGDGISQRRPLPRWTERGAADALMRCRHEGTCGLPSVGPLDARSPAFRHALAFFKLFYLFAPFVIVSFVRVIQQWRLDHLVALRDSAERVLDGVIAFVAPLLIMLVILKISQQALRAITVDGAGPSALAMVHLPLLAFAALSWRH